MKGNGKTQTVSEPLEEMRNQGLKRNLKHKRLRQKFQVTPDRALLGLVVYTIACIALLTIIWHLSKCAA